MDAKNSWPVLAIAVPLVIIASLVFVVLLIGGSAAACGSSVGGRVAMDTVPREPVAGYDHEQLVNAAHIMNAGQALGLSVHGQTIGVMTAMGESSLRVLDHGDTAGPDSRGLFQQRDSWGPLEDRMDPEKSATLFFQRLVAVDAWETLPPTLAAHKVQVNADPFHYERYWPLAQDVVAALGGGVAGNGSCLSGDVAYPLDQPYNMTDDYGQRPDLGVGASSQHPAIDLQNWPGPDGKPVYAVQPGTVILSDTLYLSIQHPDGYVISYLHMRKSDHLVNIGDQVAAGQRIGSVGNEGPSTGAHLDIRIKTTGTTNPQVAGLPVDAGVAGAGWRDYVNPEEFFALWGMDICPTDWCQRQY